MNCPFCDRLLGDDLMAENGLAAAFLDAYPVSPGHCLVIPRRHEPDFLRLSPEEQAAVWTLAIAIGRQIDGDHTPDGYNIGINIGAAAGQTVSHAHLHVIPRYSGDVPDPRGGIRWVIPNKAPYWQNP